MEEGPHSDRQDVSALLVPPSTLPADLAFAKLVRYSGLDASTEGLETASCVCMSGGSLEAMRGESGLLSRMIRSGHLFIYDAGQQHSAAIRQLTGDAVLSIEPVTEAFNYQVSHDKATKQFAGLTFPGPRSRIGIDGVFQTSPGAAIEPLVSLNGRPMFLRAGNIYLSAAGGIADIDLTAPGPLKAADSFSSLVVPLMFLKSVFGDACWHPASSQACLTIDDPLLAPQYGFLNYQALVDTFKEERFWASVAFIPWNRRRTRRETGELVKASSSRLSLCVHGCDHTSAEFGSSSVDHLDNLVRLATARMREHREITGIDFDRVMIFPQGVFSQAAMNALEKNNYIAAVNSDLTPPGSGDLKIRELIQPVLTAYGFPLFHRRSARRLEDFALDLFLGQPAVIGAHHDSFKEGYGYLRDFVSRMNTLDDIRWDSVGNVVQRASWLRQTAEGVAVMACTKGCSDLPGQPGVEPGPVTRVRVWARRHLSEVRDNYISRNRVLARAAAAGSRLVYRR
jgi:hypothetical protein